jgi:hypothetical protein
MKKISLKGLADYMTASPIRQRKIIRDYKYPALDDASAKILYYREARDRISAFHAGSHSGKWLLNAASALDELSLSSSGSRKTRLKHNSKAIREYKKYFGNKIFILLPDTTFALIFDDVIITVRPDLHVRENDCEKIIKLEFAKNEPDTAMIKIISQCLLEAAHADGLSLPSSNVLYYDVPRGRIHKGARMGSRMSHNIDAVCKNISAIWDSI